MAPSCTTPMNATPASPPPFLHSSSDSSHQWWEAARSTTATPQSQPTIHNPPPSISEGVAEADQDLIVDLAPSPPSNASRAAIRTTNRRTPTEHTAQLPMGPGGRSSFGSSTGEPVAFTDNDDDASEDAFEDADEPEGGVLPSISCAGQAKALAELSLRSSYAPPSPPPTTTTIPSAQEPNRNRNPTTTTHTSASPPTPTATTTHRPALAAIHTTSQPTSWGALFWALVTDPQTNVP